MIHIHGAAEDLNWEGGGADAFQGSMLLIHVILLSSPRFPVFSTDIIIIPRHLKYFPVTSTLVLLYGQRTMRRCMV